MTILDDLQQYLYRNYIGHGIYSFKIYITKITDTFCDFYIKPDKCESEDGNFRVKINAVPSDPELIDLIRDEI